MFGGVRLCCITIICISGICIPYCANAASVTFTENFPVNITRYRRQTNCRVDQFRCGSQECIAEEKECDGKLDCRDGSDETEKCMEIDCPYFRCAYGACIAKHLECNGEKNCKDNSDEMTPNCSKKKCHIDEFQCKSGQCIKEEQQCDGKAECDDNSDENEDCLETACPKSTYTCKYGGCVSQLAKCNGISECFDGSDEKDCFDRIEPRMPLTTTSLSTTACLIPENPPHGKFNIGNETMSLYKPGTYIPQFNAIRLQCEGGFEITPRRYGTHHCLNGTWQPPLATCARYCPPLTSTMSRNVKCTDPKKQGVSCEYPYDGTTATFACEPLYEPTSTRSPTSKCKESGEWNSPPIECVPICGEKRPEGTPNIVGGPTAKEGDYPWHVGIYATSDKSQICGGSVLNMRVILTAAHCFNTTDHGSNKENYLIAAGKHYRTYDDVRDKEAQYSKIQYIHTPEWYRGTTNQFTADIAVVILETPLNLSILVQPVCVDWNGSFEHKQLSANNSGIVTGWGSTSDGKPSEELNELSVPYVSYTECEKRVPRGFIKYITKDKICGGYFNKSTSVCGGDSGGGLVFKHDNGKYYIRGVVSTSPTDAVRACDSNSYATYTKVSEYLDFIKELENDNRP